MQAVSIGVTEEPESEASGELVWVEAIIAELIFTFCVWLNFTRAIPVPLAR